MEHDRTCLPVRLRAMLTEFFIICFSHRHVVVFSRSSHQDILFRSRLQSALHSFLLVCAPSRSYFLGRLLHSRRQSSLSRPCRFRHGTRQNLPPRSLVCDVQDVLHLLLLPSPRRFSCTTVTNISTNSQKKHVVRETHVTKSWEILGLFWVVNQCLRKNACSLALIPFLCVGETMTMTMAHSEKSIQHLSVAWPYRHEWKGRDPTKKSLLKLMGLARLVRCVHAHCWWQRVVTSNTKARKNESNTGCCWYKFTEFENRGSPSDSVQRRWAPGKPGWQQKKSVAGTVVHQSGQCWRFPSLLNRNRWRNMFSDAILIASGLFPVVPASPKKFFLQIVFFRIWLSITKFWINNPSGSSGSYLFSNLCLCLQRATCEAAAAFQIS